MQPFIHLNVHSEFSVTEGIIRIDDLVEHAVDDGVPAVAVTDTGNLFAAVRLYRSAYAHGVKPIIGCEMQIGGTDARGRGLHTALFLCCNNEGYRDLMRLVSKAHREHQSPTYVERDWLADHGEHLIVLSGAARGDVGAALMAGDDDLARTHMHFWARTFPDRFYMELQRTNAPNEMLHFNRALRAANREGLPVVATNRVCFLRAEDYQAHEVRSCIHHGHTLDNESRSPLHTEEQYFKSGEKMRDAFERWPEAIENSYEIARRCTVNLKLERVLLPVFTTPSREPPEEYLRSLSAQGLVQRLDRAARPDDEERAVYNERLEQELTVIINMDYASYFLIVADFVRWARDQGIAVGPGRGSGAGSLVAYALGITEIDPVRYKLLFERFLNPERVSMPDFDIDFCMEKRDQVIDYVAQQYGDSRVSQIISFGTMAARAVVRDVGRVFGCPYGMMDKIAKLIPNRLDITLDNALKESDELSERYEKDVKIKEIVDVSRQLEGLVRNITRHAGGVVISPDELTEHTALFYEPSSQSPLTQLDMKDLEKVGLVKFDFLGLRTLTVIDRVTKSLRKQGVRIPDWQTLPLDNKETYELLQAGRTTAVFQLESAGVRRLLKRIRPDCFDDVVAVVALYRPGPLQSGMVDSFIERKHGADVRYLHPELEEVLRPTYGVIVYQEQVMEIAQILAGYTLGSADILRRAMGKKLPEQMAEQREVFVNNAVGRGVDKGNATEIFDLMEKFAGYGFNKSHSVAYALIAYFAAWLKVGYPDHFMAATMSSDMADTDKIESLIRECEAMDLKVAAPDVNRSEWEFTVSEEGVVVYGLGAVRSLGWKAMQAVVDERNKNGPYRSLDDLCARVAPTVRKNMLEVLVRSGGLDQIGDRANMLYRLPLVYALAEQNHRHTSANQSGLFSSESTEVIPEPVGGTHSFSPNELLKMEKDVLGLYLSDHPIRWYKGEIAQMNCRSIRDLKQVEDNAEPGHGIQYRVAGVITDIGPKRSNWSGMVFTLDDGSGRMDLRLKGQVYSDCQDMLVHDEVVIVNVRMEARREFRNWRVLNLMLLDEARRSCNRITIGVDTEQTDKDFCDQLKEELVPFRANGHCPVFMGLKCSEASAELEFGAEWRVAPCNEIIERLQRLRGIEKVELGYTNNGSSGF